jgi:hypothetical protein
MTTFQTLPPSEINRMVAEACGWEVLYPNSPAFRLMGRRDGGDWIILPDYLSDLNACFDMEQTIVNEAGSYCLALAPAVGLWQHDIAELCHDFDPRDQSTCPSNFHFPLAHATPKQRVEAFGRLKGLWT